MIIRFLYVIVYVRDEIVSKTFCSKYDYVDAVDISRRGERNRKLLVYTPRLPRRVVVVRPCKQAL